MKLRDYQVDLIARIHREMRTHRWVCAVMPTGAGKTLTGTEVVRRSMKRGKRIYWMTHRRELIEQTSLSFVRAQIPHGLIAAGEPRSKHSVQICSVQTVARRLDTTPSPDLIIFDECHHGRAGTWMKIIERWKKSFCIGLTATPIRLDGKGLAGIFGGLVKGPSIQQLIEWGYLSQYSYYGRDLDMRGVKKTAGEYNRSQMAERARAAHIVGDLMEEYNKRGGGQMLVFAPTVEYSKAFAGEVEDAAHVDGTTPKDERHMILTKFREKKIKILSNVELFTEGLDVPGVDIIGMLRPTQSLGLFLQMAGRGMRRAEGKTRCIILDHAGNYSRHGLICDERDWKLLPDKTKRQNEVSHVTCEGCFGAFRGRTCPYCGHVRTRKTPREIKEEKGRLIEIKKQERKKALAQINSLADAVAYGKRMNYKEGWARYYWLSRRARGTV